MITTEAIRARFGHQEKYSLLSRTEIATLSLNVRLSITYANPVIYR